MPCVTIPGTSNIKRSEGGSDHPHNLICLCANCHALIHGIKLTDWDNEPEDIEQAVVEYLADLYADDGIVWNPWHKL